MTRPATRKKTINRERNGNLHPEHTIPVDTLGTANYTMPDNSATSGEPAAAEAAAAVAKLHLDEVTGEMISKTELKKRQKQREKEAAKKEKAAANPKPPAASTKNAEAAEKELTPNQVRSYSNPFRSRPLISIEKEKTNCWSTNIHSPYQYFEIRSRTVNELHAQGKAYPHKVDNLNEHTHQANNLGLIPAVPHRL